MFFILNNSLLHCFQDLLPSLELYTVMWGGADVCGVAKSGRLGAVSLGPESPCGFEEAAALGISELRLEKPCVEGTQQVILSRD